MRAFRICKARWEASAFTGAGAAEFPGRWNLPGEKVVYCAESRSLGSLEVLAHVTRKHTLAHARFVAIAVDIPDELIFHPERLPRRWDARPHEAQSQRFGSRLVAAHAAVAFPSVITRGEFNVVLNPLHPDFARIKIRKAEPLSFDTRVLAGTRHAA
jgi:RES domain-containing protein